MLRRLAPLFALVAGAAIAQTYIGPVGKPTPGAASVQGPDGGPVSVICLAGCAATINLDGGLVVQVGAVSIDGGYITVGIADGGVVGLAPGSTVGIADGGIVGLEVGSIVGIADGGIVGLAPGTAVELTDGTSTAAMAAASAPTAYSFVGQVVAQRPTTVATAGSQATLGTGSNTHIFTLTAGICSITVFNEDSTNTVRVGETTGSVSTTAGIPLLPYTGTTFIYYGGDIYARAVSGTPIVDVQPGSCP